MNTTLLPQPLDTIIIENKKGTYKDFQASADYPLKGVTYPVDYGYLPGYTGEDNADLDFFVGSEEPGLSGFIRVSRPDTENGETKFFTNVTNEDIDAICVAFKPVLIEQETFTESNAILLAIQKFKVKNSDFWQQLDTLVAANGVQIERPKGSVHPRYPGYIYPVDYGFIPGTKSSDGAEMDAWIGSGDITRVNGMFVTSDPQKGDIEIKVLIGCSPEETETALASSNRGEMSAILVSRL
jgi:inorganic pyrophosphatase